MNKDGGKSNINARREAKRNPNKRFKLSKDPGVPNIKCENLTNRLNRIKEKNKDNAQVIIPSSFKQISDDANKAQLEYQQKEIFSNENCHFIDTSRRHFFKEFKKVVKSADVIIQVLDARDPLGTRSREIERQIQTQDPKKKIILVLNKIDLIPRQNLIEWLRILRNELPTIAFKSSVQQQRRNIGQQEFHKNRGTTEGFSECLGASTLIELLKNYSRSQNIKMSISVGIIGIPNVGKSSLINSLKRSRAVGVGAKPGFTKTLQEVTLDKNIKLIDCPGVIFSSYTTEAESALRNSIKIEKLTDFIAPIDLILTKCTSEQMMEIYQIPEFHSTKEFLTQIAQKRGRIKSGGVLDLDASARIVLQDWNGGKIPYMSKPPRDISQLSASVVSEWGKEFDIDSVMKMEAEHVLQSIPDEPSVQIININTERDTAMITNTIDNDKPMSLVQDEVKVKSHNFNTTIPMDPLNPQVKKLRKIQAKKKRKLNQRTFNNNNNNNNSSSNDDMESIHDISYYESQNGDYLLETDFALPDEIGKKLIQDEKELESCNAIAGFNEFHM